MLYTTSFQGAPGRFEDSLDVFHDLPRLRASVPGSDQVARRIQGQHPRSAYELPGPKSR